MPASYLEGDVKYLFEKVWMPTYYAVITGKTAYGSHDKDLVTIATQIADETVKMIRDKESI